MEPRLVGEIVWSLLWITALSRICVRGIWHMSEAKNHTAKEKRIQWTNQLTSTLHRTQYISVAIMYYWTTIVLLLSLSLHGTAVFYPDTRNWFDLFHYLLVHTILSTYSFLVKKKQTKTTLWTIRRWSVNMCIYECDVQVQVEMPGPVLTDEAVFSLVFL